MVEQRRGGDGPPFYFICVFWGAEFRLLFQRFCLASLLSPKNIPALDNRTANRFVICTTAEDWTALQQTAEYRLMIRVIEPLFIEIPAPQSRGNKYLVMSSGHRLAAERAFHDGAYGVFLTPDLVLSDGSVAELRRRAEAGAKVVLVAAIRFTSEGCLPKLEELRDSRPDAPLTLPPRTLMAIALRHLHPETLRYDWDTPSFAAFPYSVFWRVAGGDDIVLHSFSWAPLLIDYTALAAHDVATFENWTLDGDYVYRNFPNPDDVHIVTDSDDIALVSFTSLRDMPGPVGDQPGTKNWYKRWPVVGHLYRIWRLHFVYHCAGMDPLKQRIFPIGVRFHAEDPSPAWQTTERQTARLIKRVLNPSFVIGVFFTLRYNGARSAFWYALTYPLSRIPPARRQRLRVWLGLRRG